MSLENLTRREFVSSLISFYALSSVANASQLNQQIPMKIFDKSYKLRLKAFNLRNPGDLASNSNGNLYFVQKNEENEEGVYEITPDKIIYRLSPKVELGDNLYRTKLALNKEGDFFVYQSNAVNESLCMYGNNRNFELKNPYAKVSGSMQQVRDIAVNPLDNNLYIPLWSEERIDILNRKTGKLEKWASADSFAQGACFDNNANLYLINTFLSTNFTGNLRLTKITSEKKEYKMELENPLDYFKGDSFTFYNAKFDSKDNSLIMSGEIQNGSLIYNCLFKADIETKKLVPIALSNQNTKITGLEIGKNNEILLSLSESRILKDNHGMIVSLFKK